MIGNPEIGLPIQPAPAKGGEDYFLLFGLPRSHRMDQAALDAAYEQQSFEHHPDFLQGASEAEAQRAMEASAQLNEAYRVLSAEPERAGHLLSLLAQGISLDAQALPAGFLQEMFELQEDAEELTPADPAVQEFMEKVTERGQALLAERSALFQLAEAGSPATETLQALQQNLNCEKYWKRLAETLSM